MRKVFFAIIAVFFSLVGIASYVGIRKYTADKRYDFLLEQLPHRLDDTIKEQIDALYPPEESKQNAAPLYLKAGLEVEIAVGDDMYFDSLPFFGNIQLTMPPKWFGENTKKWAGRAVQDNQEALLLLHNAAELPQCRFSQTDDSKEFMRFLKPCLHLLCLDTLLAANMHDPDRTARSLLDAITFSQSLRGEPLLISQLIRINFLDTLIETSEQVMGYDILDKDHLNSLGKAFLQADESESMARACEEEIQYMGNLPQIPNQLPVSKQEIDKVVSALRQLEDSLRISLPETWRVLNELKKKMPDSANLGIVKTELRKALQVRAIITALAVEQFRIDKGKWPDEMNELCPEYLMEPLKDPFTGDDIRYRKDENGFSIMCSTATDLEKSGLNYRAQRMDRGGAEVIVKVARPNPDEKLEVENVDEGRRMYL